MSRILSIEAFEEVHRELDWRLKRYSLSGWGRRTVNDEVARSWTRESAEALLASNCRSRIGYVRALVESFVIQTRSAEPHFHFVTLTPVQFAVPLGNAAAVETEVLKRWVQDLFQRYDYLAMIEAAYYSNYTIAAGARPEPMVSWHAHLVVWGVGKSAVQQIVDQVNSEHRAILRGRKAAHFKTWGPKGGAARVIYMAKNPINEVRIFPKKMELADPETGELFEALTGEWRQRKRLLRPGDYVKMIKVLGSRTLRDLSFAAGDGRKILDSALDTAHRAIMVENEAHREKLAVLGWGPFRSTSPQYSGEGEAVGTSVRSSGSVRRR